MPQTPQTPSLTISQEKDVHIVEFAAERILDELNIAEIGQAIGALIERKDRPKLLLDFRNVDHLSSAALGMLININNRIKEQSGQLRLSNIKSPILEVFEITKLNRLFRIFRTREEALGSFQ